MDLPKDMSITVHYSTDKTVNAMATLVGNIIIFQGLIDVLPNENALAMVMATRSPTYVTATLSLRWAAASPF